MDLLVLRYMIASQRSIDLGGKRSASSFIAKTANVAARCDRFIGGRINGMRLHGNLSGSRDAL